MTVSHQKQLSRFLGAKTIAYNTLLSEVLGSITASIFLNQLLYWYWQGNDPQWIYKTVLDFQKETGLTKDQQLTAQKLLVAFGIIEVKLKGVPPKRHFKINTNRLHEVCNEFLTSQKSG